MVSEGPRTFGLAPVHGTPLTKPLNSGAEGVAKEEGDRSQSERRGLPSAVRATALMLALSIPIVASYGLLHLSGRRTRGLLGAQAAVLARRI